MQRVVFSALTAVMLQLGCLGIPAAYADETFELLNGANVIDAKATPTPKGGTSQITLRLENFGNTDVYLIGIRSKKAESGTLMIRPAGGPAQAADQYLVKSEETLDLTTSHIWMELRGMHAPLAAGEAVDFDLVFRNGISPGVAHVHP